MNYGMQSCYWEKLAPTKICIADLVDYYGGGMLITRLNVPAPFRRQGHGRKLLTRILEDADKHKVILFLEVVPSSDNGMTYDELAAWYKRHGFEGDMVLTRRPR